MKIGTDGNPPKKPVRPHTSSEDENEPPQLVEEEPVDIEREAPISENEPVERVERNDKAEPPIFEE